MLFYPTCYDFTAATMLSTLMRTSVEVGETKHTHTWRQTLLSRGKRCGTVSECIPSPIELTGSSTGTTQLEILPPCVRNPYPNWRDFGGSGDYRHRHLKCRCSCMNIPLPTSTHPPSPSLVCQKVREIPGVSGNGCQETHYP